MLKRLFSILILCLATLTLTGCFGEVVPPGKVVVIRTPSGDTSIYKEGVYKAWGRDRAYFIDAKLKAYSEDNMPILCQDKVNIVLDVKWLGSFDVTQSSINMIVSKVPSTQVNKGEITGYELSLDKFYVTAMRDIVRSNARKIVSVYTTEGVQENRTIIQSEIKKNIIERFSQLNFPISTIDIMISDLQFDKTITQTRQAIKDAELLSQRQAAEAKAAILSAKREMGIATEEGKARIIRAQTVAKENQILGESITKELIQLKQIEMMRELLKSPNKDTIVIPYSAMNMTDTMLNRKSIQSLK